MKFKLFVTGLVVMCNACIAFADVRVNYTIEYYDVTGSTISEIGYEFKQKGPVGHNTGRRHAATTVVRTSVSVVSSSTYCKPSDFIIDLHIRQIFPNWINRHQGSSSLQRKWDEWIKAVVDHENVHRDEAVMVINEYYNTLRNISSWNCYNMQEQAMTELKKSLNKLYEYDRITDHGRNNGTQWW
jgi:predicted secreted Zn-dependent protease